MKHAAYRYLLLFLLVSFPFSIFADSVKAPVAEISEPVFTFKKMMEDKEVLHDFIIKNKGNMVLEIKKVETGCGCTAVSFTRYIPPGSVGKISVKFDTSGYGGMDVSKSISVTSSDPKKEKFYLQIKGSVESFADIDPHRVRLIGYYKDKIESRIKIVSKEKYPFKILSVSVSSENKDKVKIELKRLKEEKTSEYLLIVENLTKKRGRFFDKVKMKTDSKLKPEIVLPLSAFIFDKN